MFKSVKDEIQNNPNYVGVNTEDIEPNDMQFVKSALIQQKINSAINLVHKRPIDIQCTAIDPLAEEKKQEDINFLKNMPAVKADLDEIAAEIGVGEVDLGATKHSATPYSSSPYGLDLTDPEDSAIMVNIFYKLGIEAAFETALQTFYELKIFSK